MDDMVRAGRSCAGEANGAAVLFSEDVIEILRMIGEGRSIGFIARKFGVGKTTIAEIARGKTHKDVPGSRREAIRPTNLFYGASYNEPYGKWLAYFSVNGKRMQFGYFPFEGDAAICVNAHVAYLGLERPLNVITEADWHHD
jgi:hypothetical protein